jgi:hypothetical protein
MSTVPLIYKYSNIKDILEESHTAFNPIFLNPYATYKDILRHISPTPNNQNRIMFQKWVASNSNNMAISMLFRTNPSVINLDGLVLNKNINIGPLLENCKDRFETKHWNIMSISHNPTILKFLEKNPTKICWSNLSSNSSTEAIRILKNNIDKIQWFSLSNNSAAIDILENNQDKIDWERLSENENAINLIENNLDKINWSHLSLNPSAIHILENNLDKIDFANIMMNPKGMQIMENHPELCEEYFYYILSQPNAIHYIEENIHKFNSNYLQNLAFNTKAFPLIQKLLDTNRITKDDLITFASKTIFNYNKSLYLLDYQAMSKIRSKIIYQELIMKALHPDRVSKWLDYYCDNGGDIQEFNWT